MREKFIRFMNGRNGMDELARAESWVVMILLVVSIFTRSAILDILAIGLMIHMYFRVFFEKCKQALCRESEVF
mgnify:CR=1 FL=1